MAFLKVTALIIIGLYLVVVLLLYLFQAKLIFLPGKLSSNYRFTKAYNSEELMLTTSDHEKINALFFNGTGEDVILYFHGNAGDLSGWQYVAEDFTGLGFSVLIIDYRGYGKSTGTISEKGFYHDAEAAYEYLIEKGYKSEHIIIYGRSIGTGVAVELATRVEVKGVVLESPYTSIAALANEKLPFFFPSLYLKFRFNTLAKLDKIKSPVIFLHGSKDTLIPYSHTEKLYQRFKGSKRMILFPQGTHNDLSSFNEYKITLTEVMPQLFDKK